jgi:hypothetical protein
MAYISCPAGQTYFGQTNSGLPKLLPLAHALRLDSTLRSSKHDLMQKITKRTSSIYVAV